MPEQKYGLRWPVGDAQAHKQRALLLWAQASEAHSIETRAELERLALLYERLAERATRRKPIQTLGDVVIDKTRAAVPEAEWFALVQRMASGNRAALQSLCLWTLRFVFTFLMGMTNDVFAAEELTVKLYQDIWLEAAGYDPREDSVMAWVMNKARATALEISRFTREAGVRAAGAAPAAREALEVIEGARKLAELSSVPAIDDEPGMEERASGIYAKLLAADGERGRLGMLVRLAPGAAYPPHVHAGIEQLYLLQGELWIDGRKLYPGDYNRAEPSTADMVVWSETGCTCILVTSSADRLT
jgi:ChrR Cupin-like domain